eukprot:Rhum_TRINITY_DN20904_c0_g1::Rhum_TRINITY_DN20904_c0_g1_i1::g.172559::m.172559/K08073/PNKP; bifunctional polynucleotide phosphatase/kinase
MSREVVRWLRSDDTAEGGWAPYDALHTKALEQGYKSFKARARGSVKGVELPVRNGPGVRVDFRNMTESSADSDADADPVEVKRETGDAPVQTKGQKRARSPPAKDSASDDRPSPKKARVTGAAPVGHWHLHEDSVIVYSGKGVGLAAENFNGKVVGFDMDDTVITTASGNVHAKSATDWKFLLPKVPAVLKELHESGCRVILFSNQGGIQRKQGSLDESKATMVKSKIDAIRKKLGFPVEAFLATTYDAYRKPSAGMWELLEDSYPAPNGVAIDRARSVYVGDAAGRTIETLAGKGKDFSCGDRKFAHNVGVRFQTPENFYEGRKEAEFSWGKGFNPEREVSELADTPTTDGRTQFAKAGKQELVMFVGPPASGKSTFAQHFIDAGYTHVNRDTLKTPAKCLKLTRETLAAKGSVVVDNTNPKPETREEYIKIAQKNGVPVRCFYFTASKELAKHLNVMREVLTNGERRHVPDIAYNMYYSGFEEPTKDEGFQEITEISFTPKFDSDKHKKLFHQFLSE